MIIAATLLGAALAYLIAWALLDGVTEPLELITEPADDCGLPGIAVPRPVLYDQDNDAA